MVSEAGDPGQRAGLLPAYVEIMAANGALQVAEEGCAELDSIAEQEEEPGVLAAMAAQVRGLVDLAAGQPQSSLPPLRRADELGGAFRRRMRVPGHES